MDLASALIDIVLSAIAKQNKELNYCQVFTNVLFVLVKIIDYETIAIKNQFVCRK